MRPCVNKKCPCGFNNNSDSGCSMLMYPYCKRCKAYIPEPEKPTVPEKFKDETIRIVQAIDCADSINSLIDCVKYLMEHRDG